MIAARPANARASAAASPALEPGDAVLQTPPKKQKVSNAAEAVKNLPRIEPDVPALNDAKVRAAQDNVVALAWRAAAFARAKVANGPSL